MMPFSPLRTWGLGLLSWAILVGGAYCLWQWAHVEKPVAQVRVPASREIDPRDLPGGDLVGDQFQPVTTRRADRGWYYLIAGLLLVGLSGGGLLPVTLLLGRPGVLAPRAEKTGEVRDVDRPDGSRLHVQIHGRKEGPTLVFTHGWSLDGTSWFYQKKALAERFRLVIWDLPGLGRSKGPQPPNYSLEKMANDLEAVIQIAGKGPIVLVGHSIGGMITQTYCRLNPKQLGPRVAGIVLLTTTYTNPLRTAFLSGLWTAIEKPVLVPLNHLTVWLAPLAWLSNIQSYLNGSLHIMTRMASFAGEQTWGQVNYGAWLAAKSSPGVVARGNLAMLEFDEQATLPTLEIPVLVIGCKHDRMTKVSASEQIEQALPMGAIAVVPAGHLGFWEQHEKVTKLIAEFAEQFAESKSGNGHQTHSLLRRETPRAS